MTNEEIIENAAYKKFQDLGWKIRGPVMIHAIKTYQTAVGPKDVHASLWNADDEYNQQFRLSGEYCSKGNNILSTSNVYIPKSADVGSVQALVEQFVNNIDLIIKDSYAVRLLTLLESDAQQDNLHPTTEVHMSDQSTKYGYYINLDERGEFYADVRDADDNSIFEINGFGVFEDGFMRDKNDIAGLQEMLIDLQVIDSDAEVLSSDEFESLSEEEKGGMALS